MKTQSSRKPLILNILELLNDRRSPVGDELRGLVDEWLQAPSLSKMLASKSATLPTFPTECHNAWQVFWVPSSQDRSSDFNPGLGKSKDAPAPEAGAHLKAVRWFVALTLDPKWNRLAGPCARCNNYYLKKKASQNVYCSRRCGNAATAVVRTREKVAADRADKLHRAAKTVRKLRSAANWKQLVSAKHPDITPKFLTRATNKAAGELVGGGWTVRKIAALLESRRKQLTLEFRREQLKIPP